MITIRFLWSHRKAIILSLLALSLSYGIYYFEAFVALKDVTNTPEMQAFKANLTYLNERDPVLLIPGLICSLLKTAPHETKRNKKAQSTVIWLDTLRSFPFVSRNYLPNIRSTFNVEKEIYEAQPGFEAKLQSPSDLSVCFFS